MITVTGISTQAKNNTDSIRYRFRNTSDIAQAVCEASQSRHGQMPMHTDNRGIPDLNPSSTTIIGEMEAIQQLHNKTKGIRIREEMVTISKDELAPLKEKKQIRQISDRLSDFYYDQGFQCVYGVYPYHDDRGDGYDILYTINTVSFRDGSKYKRNSTDYLAKLQNAAETTVRDVTNTAIPDSERFDFEQLEYAD